MDGETFKPTSFSISSDNLNKDIASRANILKKSNNNNSNFSSFEKIDDDCINTKNIINNQQYKANTIKNPKQKKKYTFIENFLKNTQKNIEIEEKLFNENLPFRKNFKKSLSINKDFFNSNQTDLEKEENKVPCGDTKNSNQEKKSYYERNYEEKNLVINTITNESKGLLHEISKITPSKRSKLGPIVSNKAIESDESDKQLNLYSNGGEDLRMLFKFNNVYDSFSDEEIQEQFYLNEGKFFILDNDIKWYWDILIIILIFYSALCSPLSFAFTGESFNFLFYNEIVLDYIFIIDIIIQFFSPFNDDDDFIIMAHRKIAKNYIEGWFIVDVLSTIPFNFIIYINNSFIEKKTFSYHYPYNTMLYITSSFCIFKWIKIIRLLKLLKYEFLSDLKFISNSKKNRLFKSACIFIILIHFSSCFFIYLGLISYDPDHNWIAKAEVCQNCYFDIYLASIYFNLVTIFSIGYGDITCQNKIEMSYNIFLLMIGVLLFSFAVSSLSSLFSNLDNKTAIYNNKLNILDNIQIEFKLSDSMYKMVRQYIKIEFNRNNNDRYELLDSLPSNIKNELTIYMYKVLIKNQKFFKGQSHDFILFVLPFLKSHKIHKNEILFSVGEFVEEAYLVVKGCLAMNLGPLYENLEIGVVRENGYFGDLLMNANEQSPYELKCKSKFCEVLVLKKAYFIKIKSSFNENIIKILKESYKILEIVDKRRQQFLQLYFYEDSVEGVKAKMKGLNMYLMNKGFHNYFYHDIDFENANDFLINNDFHFIMSLIKDKEFYPKGMIKNHVNNNTNNTLPTLTSYDLNSNNFVKQNASTLPGRQSEANSKNQTNNNSRVNSLINNRLSVINKGTDKVFSKRINNHENSERVSNLNKNEKINEYDSVIKPIKDVIRFSEKEFDKETSNNIIELLKEKQGNDSNLINIKELKYINNNINNNNNNIIINVGIFNDNSSNNETLKSADISDNSIESGEHEKNNKNPKIRPINKEYPISKDISKSPNLMNKNKIVSSLNTINEIKKFSVKNAEENDSEKYKNHTPKLKKTSFLTSDKLNYTCKKSILLTPNEIKRKKSLIKKSKTNLLEMFRKQIMNGPNLDLQREESALNEKTMSLLNFNRTYMKQIEKKMKNKASFNTLNDASRINNEKIYNKLKFNKTLDLNKVMEKEKKKSFNDTFFLSQNIKKRFSNIIPSNIYKANYFDNTNKTYSDLNSISAYSSSFYNINSKSNQKDNNRLGKELLIVQSTNKFQILQNKSFKNLMIEESFSLTIINVLNTQGLDNNDLDLRKPIKTISVKSNCNNLHIEEYNNRELKISNNKDEISNEIEDFVKISPLKQIIEIVETSNKRTSYGKEYINTLSKRYTEDNERNEIKDKKERKNDKKTIYNIKIGSRKLGNLLTMLRKMQTDFLKN